MFIMSGTINNTNDNNKDSGRVYLEKLRFSMANLAQFCLDNMDKSPSRFIQAEFDILYNEYHSTLMATREVTGMSENDIANQGLKNPVEIPIDLQDQFEEWFSDRIQHMLRRGEVGSILN